MQETPKYVLVDPQNLTGCFPISRNPFAFAFQNPHLGFQMRVAGTIGGFVDGENVASGRSAFTAWNSAVGARPLHTGRSARNTRKTTLKKVRIVIISQNQRKA